MGSKSPKLDVYWNLHQDLWSVKDHKKVVLHRESLIAENVSFVVQPAGRQRVIKTGKKNVHAFVRAESIVLLDILPGIIPAGLTRVRYNPYKFSSFVDESGNPISKASFVFMGPDGKCYAKI